MLRLLRMSYKLGMYRKTLLGNKHCYVMLNTFLVILIKLQFFLSLLCLIATVYGYSIILSSYGYLVIIKLVNGSIYVLERKASGLGPSQSIVP